MADKLHEYFKRTSSEWCVTGFLDECKTEPFERKIDQYLRCLYTIAGDVEDKRKERAETLLKDYKEDPQTDRKKARKWNEERSSKQVHYHQPIITDISGNMTGNIGTMTGGSFVFEPKREVEDQELFGSNMFSASEDEYVHSQETLNEGIKLPASSKRGNETEKDVSNRKKVKKTRKQPGNGRSSESPLSDESNKELNEDDVEIKFDLTSISIELQREPIVKWNVGHINVTDRFRQYQKEIIKKVEIKGLKYDNIYELLALSSIIVLSWPCPYPSLFTIQEWKEVTESNPHTVKKSLFPPEILSSLNEASFNHFLGMDTFMEGGKSKLGRLIARSFNDLYDSTMKIAPLKLSEEEHCLHFVYPIARPFFVGEKEYDLVLNRSNTGSKRRPDLSCVVDGVPILNSEFKPLGNTPLQRLKDRLKAQLKARKSINQQLQSKGGPGEAVIFLNMGDLMESYSMDLKYDGLYRSWPFLTTRLVVDKTMIPLAGVAIYHLASLEEHVERIAKDFKYRTCRSGNTTPTEQMSFMRNFPDSPQVKNLIH